LSQEDFIFRGQPRRAITVQSQGENQQTERVHGKIGAVSHPFRTSVNMNLSVRGKQLDVGESLRSHVRANLEVAVGKYFPRPIEANVVFSREAHRFRSDISVHVGRNIMVQSTSEDDDAYRAFDGACEKVAKRLRRYKRRLRDHHSHLETNGEIDILHANQYILQKEGDDHSAEGEDRDEEHDHRVQPVVIAEMTTAIDMLTVSEAVMRLELAELPAMMFRNRAHGGLNMIYRRPDGHVGWIDPRGSNGHAGA